MPKSSQEIREMVESLHPRSPKEVMGEAASSSLLGSTITAALSSIALLLGVTVIVFFVGGGPEPKAEAAAKPAAAVDAKPAADTSTTESSNDAVPAEPDKSDTENAIEAMGIGDSKDADSKPENLENRLDDLLNGLE